MQKIYTLALAAAVALTASADRRPASLARLNAHIKAAPAERTFILPSKALNAPAKAASVADVEGEYTWSYLDLIDDGEAAAGLADIAIVDEQTGAATVTIDGDLVLKATISGNKLSIPNNQIVGEDQYGKIYFYLKDLGSSGLVSGLGSATATVGTINGTTITFDELDVWAFGDPSAEDLGYYYLTYGNSFTFSNKWTLLGNGSFLENIVGPLFTGSENTKVSQVEVLASETNPGLYRILDPLKTLYAANKINAVSPSLDLDATDPTNVLVGLTSTGLGNKDDGLYAYFSESWYDIEIEPAITPDEYKITLKTEGNKATVTFPVKSIGIITTLSSEYFPGAPYASTLTFNLSDENAGIGDITVENAGGPATYYNLQGVRVENPSNGIFIRREGNKATKVLVK